MSDAKMARVRGGMIDMESNTTLVQCFPAHEAVPEGEGSFPAVILLHDRFGLNPHARNVANRLAHAGFYTLAPDLYCAPSTFSASAPEVLRPSRSTSFDFSEEEAARERAATLTDDRALAIAQQALAYLAGRSKARSGGAGLLGFGMGGRLAFLAACLSPGDVRAAVCFYPDGLTAARPAGSGSAAPIDRSESLAAPILIFYGLLDMNIRPEEREAVRARLAGLGKDFRMEVFPGAGHDFFCEERDTYRIRASKVAWEEALSLLR
jgi:carboxymethylenebutenolidase